MLQYAKSFMLQYAFADIMPQTVPEQLYYCKNGAAPRAVFAQVGHGRLLPAPKATYTRKWRR